MDDPLGSGLDFPQVLVYDWIPAAVRTQHSKEQVSWGKTSSNKSLGWVGLEGLSPDLQRLVQEPGSFLSLRNQE